MENERIRVVIADDHEIYRDGLKLLLRKTKEIEIVAEAEDGYQLVECAEKYSPDVILTDIKMPRMDGVAATREIKNKNISVAIVALSMFDEESLIVDMMEAGAIGYLLKNADKKEIIEAIKTVQTGEAYYCKSSGLKLGRIVMNLRSKKEETASIEFNSKELELISLICQEKTNKEIGETLFVSPRTIERYKMSLMEKMNVKSTTGIVVYAIKNHLIEVNN